MHNTIIHFRRGNYLIDVECPIAFGWAHIEQLAEALDENYLKAQRALDAEANSPD